MKLNKIIKWGMVALIVISVALLIWGFSRGFGGNAVDILLYWTYAMLGLAVFSCIVIGLIVGIVGWGDTVPPRWFWIKSSMDLAGSRFMTALGYAIQFFFIPAFIMGMIEYFG